MKFAITLVCALLVSANGLKRTPQMDRIFAPGHSGAIVGGQEGKKIKKELIET